MLVDVAKARKVLDERSETVFRNNYKHKDESPNDMFMRIAEAAASKRNNKTEMLKVFYEGLSKGYIVPGGRIMRTLGRHDEFGLPYNCYSCPPPEDDLCSIYDRKKMLAKMQQKQGGVGMIGTTLRPKGDVLKASGGTSSGAISFMDSFQNDVKTLRAGGGKIDKDYRRGALLLAGMVDYPDIIDVIRIKRDTNLMNNCNISIFITKEFEEAVKNDTDFDLKFNGKIYKTVRARDIWNEIIESNHICGEPGIIFIDRMKATNPTEYFQPVDCTNACAEVCLPAHIDKDGDFVIGACNLGSLNLYRIVKDYDRGDKFFEAVNYWAGVLTDFLDCVIDVADDKFNELISLEKDELIVKMFKGMQKTQAEARRVGVGIMGLYSALVSMKYKYGSPESLVLIKKILNEILVGSYKRSLKLGKEYGSYKKFSMTEFMHTKTFSKLQESLEGRDLFKELYMEGHDVNMVYTLYDLRNGFITLGAPTGNTSVFAKVSSGYEPIYSKIQKRNDSAGEQTIYDPAVLDWVEENPNATDFPEYVVSAMELTLEEQINLINEAIVFSDGNISKTINCKNETTLEEVSDAFYKLLDTYTNVKGITFYRDKTRNGIINTARVKNRPEVLKGQTYKRRFKVENKSVPNYGLEDSYFVTINSDESGMPYEILTSCRKNSELNRRLLTVAIAVHHALKNISSIDALLDMTGQFRETYVKEEFHKDTVTKTHYNSFLHVFADIIEEYLKDNGLIKEVLGLCPKCGKRTMSLEKKSDSCQMCSNCFYSPCSE